MSRLLVSRTRTLESAGYYYYATHARLTSAYNTKKETKSFEVSIVIHISKLTCTKIEIKV